MAASLHPVSPAPQDPTGRPTLFETRSPASPSVSRLLLRTNGQARTVEGAHLHQSRLFLGSYVYCSSESCPSVEAVCGAQSDLLGQYVRVVQYAADSRAVSASFPPSTAQLLPLPAEAFPQRGTPLPGTPRRRAATVPTAAARQRSHSLGAQLGYSQPGIPPPRLPCRTPCGTPCGHRHCGSTDVELRAGDSCAVLRYALPARFRAMVATTSLETARLGRTGSFKLLGHPPLHNYGAARVRSLFFAYVISANPAASPVKGFRFKCPDFDDQFTARARMLCHLIRALGPHVL
jgi:hypothetical protein